MKTSEIGEDIDTRNNEQQVYGQLTRRRVDNQVTSLQSPSPLLDQQFAERGSEPIRVPSLALLRQSVGAISGELLRGGREARLPRSPHVDDEEDARRAAILPHIVHERVVDHNAPPLDPRARLATDCDPAVLRHCEAKVNS